MAGEGELQAAAQRQPIDRGNKRLASRFEAPEQTPQSPARFMQLLIGGPLRALGVALDHLQVGTGQKSLLAGSNHNSADLRA